MEEKENKLVSTKIIGMIGTAATGIGLFVWNHGGQDMAADASKHVVKTIAPELVANLPEPMKNSIMGSNANEEQAKAFSVAYDKCRDEVAQNPKIDLNNSVAVYDAQIACLLVNKSQGIMLEKMSEQDAELKQTLAEIRQRISQ